MRCLTNLEKAAVIMGVILGVVGVVSFVHPRAGTMIHPIDAGAALSNVPEPKYVQVSKRGAQAYSIGAILIGGAIIALALYRPK
jgi:hypothetical protein